MNKEIEILEEKIEAIEEIEILSENIPAVIDGAKHNTLIDRNDAGAHTISAITGLEDKLNNLEALKDRIGVASYGHADYYKWADTEDIGPCYFVKLVNDTICKCTNETIISLDSLPLDEKEIVEIDEWKVEEVKTKNVNIIYSVTTDDITTYYNNENGEWIIHNTLDEITHNNKVAIYNFAINITKKDANLYYVVRSNDTQRYARNIFDIYGYDGIQYVNKSIYSYDKTNDEIKKTCGTADVFGVTVENAGFMGNDIEDGRTHDITYALVATSGLVDVMCDSTIVVGDYVVPTTGGLATKSTGAYGYAVTEIIENPDGTHCARIILAPSVLHTQAISNNVDYLLAETKRLDDNLIAVGNTAAEALYEAKQLTKDAQNSASDAQQSAQNAKDWAQQSAQAAQNAWDSTDGVKELAEQAKKDAERAQEMVADIREEAIAAGTQAAIEAAGGSIEYLKAFAYRQDEYSVGQYSQAYGLTFEQAKILVKPGTVFIPMSPDFSEKTYTEVYESDPDVTKTFSMGFSYIWTIDGWDGGTQNVTYEPSYKTGVAGQYWFVPDTYKGTDYEIGALYRWEKPEGSSYGWQRKTNYAENNMARSTSYLRRSTNSLSMEMVSVKNDVAAVTTEINDTESLVGIVASRVVEMDGVIPANYNSDTETIDIIGDEETLNGGTWRAHAKGKGNGVHYYVVGTSKPYDVYKWSVVNGTPDEKPTKESGVLYDGVNFSKINTASIITAVNESGNRSITLDADKVSFTGSAVFLDALNKELGEGGGTVIDGSNIITGTINSARIAVGGTTPLDDYLNNLEVGATIIDNIKTQYCLHTSSINLPDDNAIWTDTPPVYENGKYYWTRTYAEDADGNPIISGAVYDDVMTKSAQSNLTIGEWCIVKDTTYIDGAKIYAGTITADQIKTSAITTVKIEANAITADKIKAESITSDKMRVEELSSISANLGTVTAGVIQSTNYLDPEIIVWDNENEVAQDTCLLAYELNSDEASYIITGIGNYTDSKVIIPSMINNIPVIEIGEKAFMDCRNITKVVISDGITTIGNTAFYRCDSLTSVIIGNGVATIGDAAFRICPNLKNLVMGINVNTIGNYAFADCKSLDTIYYYGEEKDWGNINISSTGNTLLESATKYYYSETKPEAGNYWHYGLEGFKISCDDELMIDSKNFQVTQDGQIVAKDAYITGNIEAESGSIGNLKLAKEDSDHWYWKEIGPFDLYMQPYETTTSGWKRLIPNDKEVVEDLEVICKSEYYIEECYIDGDNIVFEAGGFDVVSARIIYYLRYKTLPYDTYYLRAEDNSFIIASEEGNTSLICGRAEISEIYSNAIISNECQTHQINATNGLFGYVKINTSEIQCNDTIVDLNYVSDNTSTIKCKAMLSWSSNKITVNVYDSQDKAYPLPATRDFVISYSVNNNPKVYKSCVITVLDGKSVGEFVAPNGFFGVYDACFTDGLRQSVTTFDLLSASGNSFISFNKSLIPSINSQDNGGLGTGLNLGEGSEHRWNTIYARNTTISSSDRNEKNTIQPLTDTHTQIFDALQPVSYKFNTSNNNRTHMGLIAQDVKEAVENAGLTTQDFAGYCEWEKEDGTIGCGLRYSEFIAMCINEIQKLKKRVEELETKQND